MLTRLAINFNWLANIYEKRLAKKNYDKIANETSQVNKLFSPKMANRNQPTQKTENIIHWLMV
jgi:hypothetical protein